jgi:FkbM family methyltransferase
LLLEWYDGIRVQTHWSTDESKQLYVGGCIEPNEFAFLADCLSPGMVVVDVGANNGLYTLFASRRVGRAGLVVAIEPSAREFERLQANLELNQVDNVRPQRCALANYKGFARLKVAEDEHAGHNTIGQFAYQTALARTEPVPVTCLDWLAGQLGLRRLDVLKIDAEGAELAILDGARRVLRRFRPVLLFEMFGAALQAQGATATTVVELLRQFDYQLYGYDGATGAPVPLVGELADGNWLAAPAELNLLEFAEEPLGIQEPAPGPPGTGENESQVDEVLLRSSD